jgi:hypothetical protein
MTVAEMLGRMSSREMGAWRALARVQHEERLGGELEAAAAAGVAARRPR